MATNNSWNSDIPVGIAKGGTNTTSMTTTDGVVYYDGSKLVTTAVGSSGQVLTSNGAGLAPTYQTSGGGVTIKVTTYDSSDTWTKDANADRIVVYGWSGGSGGGSGRQATSTTSGGGSGGGSGSCFYYEATANFFNATETVTIGSGGGGGGTQAGANSNGNPGSLGGTTTFGSLGVNNVGDTAGNPIGLGGTTTNAGGGKNGVCLTTINQAFLLIVSSASAGTGTNVAATNATILGSTSATSANFQQGFSISPGGGGGGSGADTGTARQAANGASISIPGNGSVIVLAGAGGIETGTINGGLGADGLTTTGGRVTGGAGGGGGGGQKTGLVAGNGGNGGIPGGGGGGGGGSINLTTSGTGGDGGKGKVIVIEYL